MLKAIYPTGDDNLPLEVHFVDESAPAGTVYMVPIALRDLVRFKRFRRIVKEHFGKDVTIHHNPALTRACGIKKRRVWLAEIECALYVPDDHSDLIEAAKPAPDPEDIEPEADMALRAFFCRWWLAGDVDDVLFGLTDTQLADFRRSVPRWAEYLGDAARRRAGGAE
jgi:hypothetical protein